MATGNYGTPTQAGPEDTPPDLTLSGLHNAPIQEESEQPETPLSLNNPSLMLTNTCLVPGRIPRCSRPVQGGASNCCEMHHKVTDLTKEIKQKDDELKVLKLEKTEAQQALQIKEMERQLLEKDRQIDKHQAQIDKQAAETQLKEKDDEIKQLKQVNEELEKKVEFLTNEKERLEECVQTLTVEMGTMKHKIDNMENHTETIKQEMEQMRVAMATGNNQCCHQEDTEEAIRRSEERMMLEIVKRMSAVNTRSTTYSNTYLSATGDKLDKYKSGLSKSNTPSPSVSPANSDHSSKPPTPPPSEQ